MPPRHRSLLPLCIVALATCLTPAVAAAEPATSDIAPGRVKSLDIAGYFGSGGNRGTAATFTVPSVTCAPTGTTGMFPSITSYYEPGADRFINGGGGVRIRCTDGTATFDPALFGPENEFIDIDQPVAPGDQIKITFGGSRSGNSSTIRNLTQGWRVTDTSPFYFTVYGDVGDSVLYVDGFPVQPPEFDRHAFTNVTLDGQKLVNGRWDQADLVDQFTGDTILHTSRLRQGAFNVVRR